MSAGENERQEQAFDEKVGKNEMKMQQKNEQNMNEMTEFGH